MERGLYKPMLSNPLFFCIDLIFWDILEIRTFIQGMENFSSKVILRKNGFNILNFLKIY